MNAFNPVFLLSIQEPPPKKNPFIRSEKPNPIANHEAVYSFFPFTAAKKLSSPVVNIQSSGSSSTPGNLSSVQVQRSHQTIVTYIRSCFFHPSRLVISVGKVHT